MIKVILLVFLAEIFFTAGNIFFKKTASRFGTQSYFIFIRNALTTPGVWLGIASMAVALMIWLMALAQRDLSMVFALGSSQYVLVLLASRFFLAEKMDRARVTGTILIAAGICLVALSAR